MSEFTSSLGNPNNFMKFINEMKSTLTLLQQANPVENIYDDYFKKWIENSTNAFLETINKFSYLEIKDIEKIKNAIESLCESMPTNTGVEIPNEMLEAKRTLESLVDTMLINYENEQQQQRESENLHRWNNTLSTIQQNLQTLQGYNKVKSAELTSLVEINERLERLIRERNSRDEKIKSE